MIIVTEVAGSPLEQVGGPAEVVRQRGAQRPGYDPSGYFPAVIEPGHRGGPWLGFVLDDAAVGETQRQEVPGRFPGGLDPQQARVPGGHQQLAIVVDDEECTVT